MIDWSELVIRLAHHIRLTAVSLGLGVLICAPLSALCFRYRWLRGPVLGAASLIQTIPSLALLALMVVLLGRIGFVPAVIALTGYSLLPLLRNCVTGLDGVDPDIIEASRGLGMTRLQELVQVRLPLALPVIVAGLRTATVWVVGMAVLATPVGEQSLGNYIFSGLQLSNNAMVVTGVLAAIALVFVLDGMIRLSEFYATRRQWRRAGLTCGVLVLSLICGTLPLWSLQPSGPARVIIGAKTFTEQYVLAELLAQQLRGQGYETEIKAGLGSTVAFEALVSGEIDVYVDYSGTIWANQMQRTDISSRQETLASVNEWLQFEHGVHTPAALGFENAYILVTHPSVAEQLTDLTIESLRPVAQTLSLGGDYEFFDRPEWVGLKDVYGLSFREQRSMDSTLMYAACRDAQVDVITAFGTDGRISAFGLTPLTDNKDAFSPYDAMVLVTAGREDVAEALRVFDGTIDISDMRSANRSVDQDGLSPAASARRLMQEIGLPFVD